MTVVLVGDPGAAAELAAHPDLDPSLQVVGISSDGPLPDAAGTAEILVPGFLSSGKARAMVDALPELKLIQLMTNGADVWVDLVGGVTVCTASGAHGGSTAEWTVGAILAVLHEFPTFVRSQDEGVWNRHVTRELDGSSVLVLGAGDLGTQLLRRLEPFGARVRLAARTARDDVIAIEDVPEVLGDFDIVVAMVPLTPATHHLVDAEFLSRMKDGAVLVNAARGAVVDTDALIAECSSGRLLAALDVTDPEPLPAGHPLWNTQGVLITPHIAGAVPGASSRAFAIVVQQLNRYVRGEQLQNVVTDRGY